MLVDHFNGSLEAWTPRSGAPTLDDDLRRHPGRARLPGGLCHAEQLAEFCGRHPVGGADSDDAAREVSAFRQFIGVRSGESQSAGCGRDADDGGKRVEVFVSHGLHSDASVFGVVAGVEIFVMANGHRRCRLGRGAGEGLGGVGPVGTVGCSGAHGLGKAAMARRAGEDMAA